MEKQYNLTIEEMIVVLFELGKDEQAKILVEAIEELGNPEVVETTLKVATRSLLSKDILDVVDDQYVFNPIFKEVIEGYLNPETTMRVSKAFKDTEIVVIVYKTKGNLYITHSMDEFIFSFNVYEDSDVLMQSLVSFSDITEGEQLVIDPIKLQEDVIKIIFENEPELYKERLLENNMPNQLVETIIEDYSIIRNIHSYVILNEEYEFIKPMMIVQSTMRSWASTESTESINFENYTHAKLEAYLSENFFKGSEKCVV